MVLILELLSKNVYLVSEWHWQISWEKFMQIFSLKTIFDVHVTE